MTARLKAHPAADLFPMMSEAELEELAADIRQRGQLEPIVVTTTGKEDLILDGRNRYEACHRVGVEPYLLTWEDELSPTASPTAFVLSKNLRRRHLNETQRAVIGEEALELFEAEAKKRQKTGKAASEPPPTLAPRGAKVAAPEPAAPKPPKSGKGKAAAAAAKAVGASTRSVERAKAVLAKKPELREQLKAAKLTLKQAEKAIRKEEQLKNVLEYRPPVGTYSVIVADVPWKYDDELDGSDQVRGATPYPPMPLEEILKVKPPAAADCALWFWTTNAFLIDGTAAQVVKAWGFEAKALYTWRKVTKDGADRLGTGHYGQNVTEHLILAVKGKPVINGGGVPNIFDAPRTSRHSQKPDAFFPIAERVTPCAPEARIELFAVDPREGWVTSGSEQQAKARAKRPDAREPKAAHDASEPILETKTDQGASLIWRERDNVLRAAGVSGVAYAIKPSTKAPGFVEVASTDGMTAQVPSRLVAKERADEWEAARLGAATSKKPKRHKVVDVPSEPEPEPREPSTSGSQIEWVDKKHPTTVAVGRGLATRRYEIRRDSKRTLQGKKIDGYVYRWFCGQDGSLKDFATVHEAKDDALRAEREWLIARHRVA